MFQFIARSGGMVFVTLAALTATAHAGTSGYSNTVVFCPGNDCSNGATPMAPLIADKAGNFYGTTTFGGANNEGAVYKVATDGTETVLYSFCSQTNCTDGKNPGGGALYMDRHGNLFGTTRYGGTENAGVVFELAPNGTETVLYSFCTQGGGGCTDGNQPLAGVIGDKAGNLYGTTLYGGLASYFGGEVYKLAPGGTLTVLWSFCTLSTCPDGQNPMYGNLLMDSSGNLYGTTQYGGSGGAGLLYELLPGMNGEVALYNFCTKADCDDGAYPLAGVVMDKKGNIYGTTSEGGDYYNSSSTRGGTAWMYSPASGTETVLHSFGSGSDGANPHGGLSVSGNGKSVYGTTVQGANSGCPNGCGIVFLLKSENQGYVEKILHAFYQSEDGDAGQPASGVIQKGGYLYGTAQLGGGDFAQGVVFRLGTGGGVVR